MPSKHLDRENIADIRESYPLSVWTIVYGARLFQVLLDQLEEELSSWLGRPEARDISNSIRYMRDELEIVSDAIDELEYDDGEADEDSGEESASDDEDSENELKELAKEQAETLQEMIDEPGFDFAKLSPSQALLDAYDAMEDVWSKYFPNLAWAVTYLAEHEFPDDLYYFRTDAQIEEDKKDGYQRAVALASAEWPDPNERCAAVTIALALLVEPEKVTVGTTLGGWVKYDAIRLTLPKDPSSRAELSLRPAVAMGANPNSPDGNGALLQNLAITYQDSLNNQEARKLVGNILPKAKSRLSKAAVLGIAWAWLQREQIVSVIPAGSSDYDEAAARTIEATQRKIEISETDDEVLVIRSPWTIA